MKAVSLLKSKLRRQSSPSVCRRSRRSLCALSSSSQSRRWIMSNESAMLQRRRKQPSTTLLTHLSRWNSSSRVASGTSAGLSSGVSYRYCHRTVSSMMRRRWHAQKSVISRRMESSAKSTDDHQYRILVLGAPGVGKGTYSKFIKREFGADTMTSGDLLRELAKQDSADGRYVKACIEEGRLVEDDIVIPMVISYLRSFSQSFILDGFPRTLNQAQRINQEYGLDIAVHFRLPRHILIEKIMGRRVCDNCGANFNVADINDEETGIVMPSLSPKVDGICDFCGGNLGSRADDKLEVVTERLKIFDETHAPILDFYEKGGCLVTHDIKRGIEDAPIIIDKMNRFLGRK